MGVLVICGQQGDGRANYRRVQPTEAEGGQNRGSTIGNRQVKANLFIHTISYSWTKTEKLMFVAKLKRVNVDVEVTAPVCL